MNRTEDYRFPEIDKEAGSYFLDYTGQDEMTGRWHFETVPELKALLRERLGAVLSEEEILEAVKLAFRNKPKEQDDPEERAGDRQVVDYIYQLY